MSFMVKKIFAVFLLLLPLRVLRGKKFVAVAFPFSFELDAFEYFQCLSVFICG